MRNNKCKTALWLKSKTKVTESGCWQWTAGKHGVGYACVPAAIHKSRYGHRAMYEAVVSNIPQGMYVLHSCDNRLCINPEHLFVGSHIDNVKDMHSKNRHRGGSMPNEKNPSCKFSDETIREIKSLRGKLSLRKITNTYGISETQLLRVYRGESRKEI